MYNKQLPSFLPILILPCCTTAFFLSRPLSALLENIQKKKGEWAEKNNSENGEQRIQRSNLGGQWTRRNPWFLCLLRLSVSLLFQLHIYLNVKYSAMLVIKPQFCALILIRISKGAPGMPLFLFYFFCKKKCIHELSKLIGKFQGCFFLLDLKLV